MSDEKLFKVDLTGKARNCPVAAHYAAVCPVVLSDGFHGCSHLSFVNSGNAQSSQPL